MSQRSGSHDRPHDLAPPLRVGLRPALVRAVSVIWPLGDAPFTVDELIEAGRALDRAAREGLPVDVAQAVEVADTLSAYVASLPADEQQAAARALVEALAERPRYEATVRLKGAR